MHHGREETKGSIGKRLLHAAIVGTGALFTRWARVRHQLNHSSGSSALGSTASETAGGTFPSPAIMLLSSHTIRLHLPIKLLMTRPIKQLTCQRWRTRGQHGPVVPMSSGCHAGCSLMQSHTAQAWATLGDLPTCCTNPHPRLMHPTPALSPRISAREHAAAVATASTHMNPGLKQGPTSHRSGGTTQTVHTSRTHRAVRRVLIPSTAIPFGRSVSTTRSACARRPAGCARDLPLVRLHKVPRVVLVERQPFYMLGQRGHRLGSLGGGSTLDKQSRRWWRRRDALNSDLFIHDSCPRTWGVRCNNPTYSGQLHTHKQAQYRERKVHEAHRE